jgi:hypothetical protein
MYNEVEEELSLSLASFDGDKPITGGFLTFDVKVSAPHCTFRIIATQTVVTLLL